MNTLMRHLVISKQNALKISLQPYLKLNHLRQKYGPKLHIDDTILLLLDFTLEDFKFQIKFYVPNYINYTIFSFEVEIFVESVNI